MEQVVLYDKGQNKVGCIFYGSNPEENLFEAGRRDVPFGMRFIVAPISDLPDQKYIGALQISFNEDDPRGLGPDVYTQVKYWDAQGIGFSYEFDDEDGTFPEELRAKAVELGIDVEAPDEEEEDDEQGNS
jgi:hypothetical protein